MHKKNFSAIPVIVLLSFSLGCVDHKLPGPLNCDDDPVVLELVSVLHADCSEKNGSIEVLATGGSGDYLYSIGDDISQVASVFQNLAAGVYEVSASDANGCSASLEVVVQNTNGLSITFQTTESGCDAANGRIIVTPFNGVEPYQYKINSSAFGSDSTFTNLRAGEHTVVVKDDTGCELSQKIRTKSGISFTETISPIIQTNCAVSGCHNGSQFPDFRVFKNIQDNAAEIKRLTGNRTMPQEGSLTQDEIDRIACWVDDGAANN